MNSIHYQICARVPETHLLEVTCIISDPDPNGQIISLPAWIPGSYLIRNFAKNVVSIRAESKGIPVQLQSIDKDSWQSEIVKDPLKISYQSYACDLIRRGAHVDNTHEFF